MEKENNDFIAAMLTIAWGAAKSASFEKRTITQTEIFNVYNSFKEAL